MYYGVANMANVISTAVHCDLIILSLIRRILWLALITWLYFVNISAVMAGDEVPAAQPELDTPTAMPADNGAGQPSINSPVQYDNNTNTQSLSQPQTSQQQPLLPNSNSDIESQPQPESESESESESDTDSDSDSDYGSDSESDSSETQSSSENVVLSSIDTTHQVISDSLLKLSQSIDEYFSNERVIEEMKGTYGCLKTSVLFQQGGESDITRSACLKMDLPHTRKRWKLFIEGNNKTEEINNPGSPLDTTQTGTQGENTGSVAGISYVAKAEKKRYISSDIGVRSRLPLDPFWRLRFRRTWTSDNWLYRSTESLYYYKSIKGGLLSRLDFERPVSTSWYTRITTQADYRDEDSEFYWKQIFGLYRQVKKGHALSWELTLSGVTQPNARMDYFLYRFRYRINVWRDWLFFEVSPQLLHKSEDHFRQVAGILFAVEAAFGSY